MAESLDMYFGDMVYIINWNHDMVVYEMKNSIQLYGVKDKNAAVIATIFGSLVFILFLVVVYG